MKERPMLFSGPMVRALLDGTKTQTRRLLKPQPSPDYCNFDPESNPDGAVAHAFGEWFTTARLVDGSVPSHFAPGDEPGGEFHDRWWRCPHGVPGDRLWVRETWALEDLGDDGQRLIWRADRAAKWLEHGADSEVFYLPSDYAPDRWRPSIHMPRGFSRLTLEIEQVRVERLQDISEADAFAEGALAHRQQLEASGATVTADFPSARRAFRHLWEGLNGDGSWDANPWVWAITFRKVSP